MFCFMHIELLYSFSFISSPLHAFFNICRWHKVYLNRTFLSAMALIILVKHADCSSGVLDYNAFTLKVLGI